MPSHRKIRVMVLAPTMHTGGAERVLSMLLTHLDRTIFAPELALVFDADLHYHIAGDVPVHVLSDEAETCPVFPAGWPEEERHGEDMEWLASTAGRLANLVKRRRPDVLVSSPLWASILTMVAHGKFPTVTRLVNRVDIPPSERLAGSDPTATLHRRIARDHFNGADAVIAISPAVARDAIDNFGVDSDRVSVILNPVDFKGVAALAQEHVSERIFRPDIPVVLFVGRLERVKGIELLLRAMQRVLSTTTARCVLVGEGSDEGRLRALVAQLGIGEDVVFTGRQTNPFKYMRNSTVLVLPSLSEGMGNVLLEAMCCGCPVITSDIAGGTTRDIVEDGACGVIVPLQDEEALASAIIDLLSDPIARERFSARGLKRAQDYDLRQTIDRYQEVFLSLVRGSGGPSD